MGTGRGSPEALGWDSCSEKEWAAVKDSERTGRRRRTLGGKRNFWFDHQVVKNVQKQLVGFSLTLETVQRLVKGHLIFQSKGFPTRFWQLLAIDRTKKLVLAVRRRKRLGVNRLAIRNFGEASERQGWAK